MKTPRRAQRAASACEREKEREVVHINDDRQEVSEQTRPDLKS